MDPERARELYVSKDPADHARGYNFKRDIDAKAAIDAQYAKASQGVMDFTKVTYRSSVGDLDIPAYLFQPLKKRGPKGHAAMVWVHGGVHGELGREHVAVRQARRSSAATSSSAPSIAAAPDTAKRITMPSTTAATRSTTR